MGTALAFEGRHPAVRSLVRRLTDIAVESCGMGWAIVVGREIREATAHCSALLDSAPQAWSVNEGNGTTSPAATDSLRAVILERARLVRGRPADESDSVRVSRGDQTLEISVRTIPAYRPRDAVLVAIRDVSDLERERRALHASYQKLMREHHAGVVGQLAMGIAHDLGNFLAALHLRIGLLAENQGVRREAGAHLDALLRISERAKKLLKQMQSVASESQGEIKPLNLRSLVDGAVEVALSGLRIKGVGRAASLEIEANIPLLPPIWGAEDELQRMLINLLVNAVDAMPNGGKITIKGRRVTGGVLLIVEDEGSGIPPEVLPRIFDPFFTTKGDHGTGLGLSMAADLMKRIGGLIRASNRPEGGARFELRFLCLSQSGNARPDDLVLSTTTR